MSISSFLYLNRLKQSNDVWIRKLEVQGFKKTDLKFNRSDFIH